MWFFETSVTHLLGKKYKNRYWVGNTETWYTFSWERRFRHRDEGSVVMWEVKETLKGKRKK